MIQLQTLIEFCDEATRRQKVPDFPGAHNGLQLTNSGVVTKVAAAVDAALPSFEKAVEAGADLLIVHHGLFWNPLSSMTGAAYRKFKFAMDHNLAVYSSHLPLDAHPEIGNNRLLAQALGLLPVDWFLPHEGVPIALVAKAPSSRSELTDRLKARFPDTFTAIEFGSASPERVAILTGSGRSALPYLKAAGTDTLITGELRQEHFTVAAEEGLNLYPCGHYATETFGVDALGRAVSAKFQIPYSFVDLPCPI